MVFSFVGEDPRAGGGATGGVYVCCADGVGDGASGLPGAIPVGRVDSSGNTACGSAGLLGVDAGSAAGLEEAAGVSSAGGAVTLPMRTVTLPADPAGWTGVGALVARGAVVDSALALVEGSASVVGAAVVGGAGRGAVVPSGAVVVETAADVDGALEAGAPTAEAVAAAAGGEAGDSGAVVPSGAVVDAGVDGAVVPRGAVIDPAGFDAAFASVPGASPHPNSPGPC